MKLLIRSSLGGLVLALAVELGHALCAQTNSPTKLLNQKLKEIDLAIENAIAEKNCPGGVLWFEHLGISYHKAYGNRAVAPTTEAMTEDTIFDIASLTK